MTSLLKNRYESKRTRDFFLKKKKSVFFFLEKENLLIPGIQWYLQCCWILLAGRQESAWEQARAWGWSRVPFVSPYLVLLRQSKAAYSSHLLLVVCYCVVSTECFPFSIVYLLLVAHYAICATFATLGFAWDQDTLDKRNLCILFFVKIYITAAPHPKYTNGISASPSQFSSREV